MKPAPTSEDFPVLGFVPCPGDQQDVTDVADVLKETSKSLGEISRVLRGADKGAWKGKTADAFESILADDFRPKVDEAYKSFNKAKKALVHWAEYMKKKQSEAKNLEEEAKLAQSNKEAQQKEDSGKKNDDDPVEEVRKRARDLNKIYNEEGRNVASQIQKASDMAPDEPGFFEDVANAIASACEALIENADWITVAASVLGVAALFFPVLAPAAFALSAVAFAAHATKYTLAGKMWPPSMGAYLTLAGDLLGAVPGFGAAYKGMKAGVSAVRAAESAVTTTKVVSVAARSSRYSMKAVPPNIPLISRPVESVAAKLGASAVNGQRISDGIQAASQLAWTAPTAYNAANPSTSATNAATRGTGLGNIITGTGNGKFGTAVAIGSALGLGFWEIT